MFVAVVKTSPRAASVAVSMASKAALNTVSTASKALSDAVRIAIGHEPVYPTL